MGDLNRFDDWSELKECDDCAHYWNSTCDGVSEGEKKPCKSFLATRRVNTKQEIEDLRDEIRGLRVIAWSFIIYALVITFFGFN